MRWLLTLVLAAPLAAEDLTIDAIMVDGARIRATVRWEGSWREAGSRDGVWLFAKERTSAGWVHLPLEKAEGTATHPCSASRDGAGATVQRMAPGRGAAEGQVSLTATRAPQGPVQLFGLEMVRVASRGVPAFWLAKYEVGQGAYADFLDHLPDQATFARSPLGGRTYGGPTGTITKEDTRYVAGRPDAACGFLSWEDACAFADWSGLRPPHIEELELVAQPEGLWEPALRVDRLDRAHGDGALTRDGRANAWPAGGAAVEYLGADGQPVRLVASERRPNVGFRPARTAPGTRTILILGTDACAGLAGPLQQLSEAGGAPRVARVTARGRAGDQFARMAQSETLLEELRSGRHEVVLLQEDLAVLGGARRAPEHVRPLVDAARQGGATVVLVQTWGFRDRPSVAFVTAAANVKAWAEELDLFVAPLGLAWRRARASLPEVELYDEGGRNPSAAGQELNACVLTLLLEGSLPEGVDPDLGRVAEQVAREFVQVR